VARITFLGTSHTYDRFNTHPGYQAVRSSDLTWSEYIGERISSHVDNIGIVAMGIDTYFPRLYSYLNNHPKPDMVVLEIPGSWRFQYPIENKRSSEHDYLKSNFWQHLSNEEETYVYHLMRITAGDLLKQSTPETIKQDKKYIKINKNATEPISPHQYVNFLNFHLNFDYMHILYNTTVKIHIISEFLKQQDIIPICWTMDAINSLSKSLTNDVASKLNLISDKSIRSIGEDRGYHVKNKLYYPDGTHLIQEKWREIADDIFIPVINEYLK